MTGQDAAVTAKTHFGEALPLTGVVLTKTDGDARGGAALSVLHHRQADQVRRRGESPMAWTCSIRSAPPAASSTWATCCRWSEQVEAQVDKDKAQKLAEKVAKARSSTSTTCATSSSRCRPWAACMA